MKDNIELMDKAIKDKFDGHEVPVPSHVWSAIESNLPSGKDNTDGFFFLKNIFILSILFISTVVVGTYVYDSINNKTQPSKIASTNTTPADNTSTNSSISSSATNSHNSSSVAEKNQTGSAVSNSVLTTIDTENKNQTTHSSSNTHKTVASNVGISKIKEKSSTNASSKKQSNSETTNDATINNTYSKPSKNTIHGASNKNIQQHVTGNTNTNTNQSNTIRRSTTSSGNVFSKGTENNNSSSSFSNTNSNQAESITATSTTSENKITQAPTKNTSANTVNTAAHTDSIKQYAAVSMQKTNAFDKSDNRDLTHSSGQNTSTNDAVTVNKAIASSPNQHTNLNAAQISNTTLSLNSINTESKPYETASIYNQSLGTKIENSTSFTNKQFVSNITTNASNTSSNNTFIDSVNNRNSLENYFYTNSIAGNDTAFAFLTNNVSKEILFKIDSIILAKHIDTSSSKENCEIAEAKLNKETKKKKPLFISRCSFDGYATPALGYIYLSPNSNQENISAITKGRNQNASPGFGITSGLRMNYSLTQKLEIGIGLQYSSLSQQSSLPQKHFDSTHTTHQGYMKIDSIYDSSSQHYNYISHYVLTGSTVSDFYSMQVKTYTDKFKNFSIPIHIAYGYSISNKLSLIARTSFLINYQTYSITYLNAADSSIVGYHSSKNISLGGSFSIGCYYQFSKKYSVFAEPIVSYYFSNLFDKQVPFKQKQLMLGLQTGIRLSF